MDAPMASQPIQFYQYRPDSEARHNAVFTPMPGEQPMYGSLMAYPHAHYTAPQYWQPPTPAHHGHFAAHRIVTPQGSPPLTLAMPMPKIVVDQNGQMDHGRYFHTASPPTPCLSACPSTASSPPASAIQQTPIHGPSYFSLPIEAFNKENLQVQSFSAVDSWDESHPVVHVPSSDAKLLSARESPCLSPASPESQTPSSAYPVAEFVNLRDLTSGSFDGPAVSPAVQACPPLPTLSAEDEEHKIAFGASTTVTGLPLTPKRESVDPFTFEHPSFDSSFCSELDSEEDGFSFVNFGETDIVYHGDKRLKLSADDEFDIHSFGSFDEEDGPHCGLPSPPPSLFSDSSCCGTNQSRTMSKRSSPDTDGESPTGPSTSHGASSHHHDGHAASTSQSQSSSTDGHAAHAADQSSSHAPANRRGRKQSLTEDPSKTFVCTLCSRRFRRQEHLKRHYRSLHTQDKPFECNECGKRFSRSDNLAQHARTHGSGAIVMGVLENGELQPTPYEDEMSVVLYEAAHRAAAATSSSGSSSDSSSDGARGMKKRKREEMSV